MNDYVRMMHIPIITINDLCYCLCKVQNGYYDLLFIFIILREAV